MLIRGQVLIARGDPLAEGPGAYTYHRHGAIRMEGGRISSVDTAEALPPDPGEPVTDMGAHLLLPGFVDAHVHYPQTAIIASWGKRLRDWLNTYTFPEEARFGDPDYARAVAERYLDLMLANGTTTAASFCTVHPESVDALMGAAQARGLAMVAGKTCMDRNAPVNLRDTAQTAYDDSAALMGRWHGVDRLRYAISPRFTPTSTRGQLDALGALWAMHPDCVMQTHLSEQAEEVAWVRDLHPGAYDYLHTYERAGLIGPGAVMGHAIHLSAREKGRMAETGTGVAHCPTSNFFIGSGLCDVAGLWGQGIPVGLGTDTGGGSSFSMLRTMAAAYEVAQLRGRALHPAELLWLATEGSARVLGLAGQVGRLAAGALADILALDLGSTPAIAQAAARADDIWQALFPTIMMGDDRAVAAVWIAGKPLSSGREGR